MNSNQLASLALFQAMYDKGDDIYQIISYFIKNCLHRRNNLTISDLQSELKLLFGFDFPFAVLRTTLNKRKNEILKKDGAYYLDPSVHYIDPLINERTKQEKFIYEKVLRELVNFIAKKENIDIRELDENLVLDNLCSYLLKRNDDNMVYYEHIASFILCKNNKEVQDFLQNTFDSSIVLAGLEYQNDTNEIYNLRKNLILYLDVEWLFSSYGYNGEIYQKIFLVDFLPLIKELNQKKSKAKIKLRILPKTKDDIDKFFDMAQNVLTSGAFRENNAMKMILNNCSSKSDVVAEKHKFMKFLRDNDIIVDENAISLNLNNKDEYGYNLDNVNLRKKFSKIEQKELDEHFQILNTINKLRVSNSVPINASFEDSEYVFITATRDLIAISKEIKDKSIVPLSIDIGFVINRLWFKLQKSFKSDERLLSLDILVNARIALDSVVNNKLNRIYHELMEKYKRKEISKELAAQLISEYREKTKNNHKDNYNENSFIFEDDIDKAIEEMCSKSYKLKVIEEDNNEKAIKISSLEEEKMKLENDNKNMHSLLEKYKSKEEKREHIKKGISRFIRKLVITSIVVGGIFLVLRYVIPMYERELSFLSIFVTIATPFWDYLKK